MYNAVSHLPIADEEDKHTALVTEMMEPNRHPLTRARGYALRAVGLHTLGRHEEALVVEAEAEKFTKDHAPGVRLAYLEIMRAHRGLLTGDRVPENAILRHADSVMEQGWRETLDLAEAADVATRVRWRLRWAELLLNQGRLRESAREWDDLSPSRIVSLWRDSRRESMPVGVGST